VAPPVSAPPVGPEVHRSYAGLVSRLSALVIDVAILAVVMIAVRLLPHIAWDRLVDHRVPGWVETAAGSLATILPWLYFTISWSINGQTLGDMLIGVEVRGSDGQNLSLLRSAIRAAVGLLTAPLWILGLLYGLWDRRRRAVHDLIFGTVVVYTSPPRTGAREIRRRNV
jgi:uncharacterized RDD family membrane protein YckC